MRYFLDTEYNGFGGELISLALAPEFGDHELYLVLPLPAVMHPWVERNVVPYLLTVPPTAETSLSRLAAAAALAEYLGDDADPVIVADWPEDIGHFCALITIGPGEMVPLGPLRFELMTLPGFSTAENSAVPHNALHDARALREFVLESETH